MVLYFDKFESVGQFRLGSQVNQFDFPFEVKTYDDYGDHYNLDDKGLTLIVDHNLKITSIICTQELLINGVNIIGMSYGQFENYMQLQEKYSPDPLDFEENSVPQLVYDIDEYGLQIWTKNNQIVTAIVNEADEEE